MQPTTQPATGFDALHQCAAEVLAERQQRYLAQLERLIAKCNRYGYASEQSLVADEIQRIASGDSTQPSAKMRGFSELMRARLCFDRDTEMIRSHLPEWRTARRPAQPSLFERLFAAFRATANHSESHPAHFVSPAATHH